MTEGGGFSFAGGDVDGAPEDSIRGIITHVSRGAGVVLVEEYPSEESGSAKGEFAVTEEMEILERRGGQRVEATYAGAAAESHPAQGVANKIVILDDDDPAVLPDKGGASLPVPGVLLIVSGLLARLGGGYSLR